MSGPDHDHRAEDAGAYLLGALSELEARAFERHAMACAECRDELDRLRPAADAVGRSAEQFAPPPGLRESLMATVRAEAGAPAAAEPRRLPRFRPLLAAAAAAFVLVGAGIGLALGGGGSGSRVVQASARLPGASAKLTVGDGAGTLRVAGLPVLGAGRVYEVWIQRGGTIRPAGALFAVDSRGAGAAGIPGKIERGDRVMVTRERAGGVPQPTEAPILSARA